MIINEALYELRLPYNGNSKTVRVFVPEHSEGELLPVMYMTDGQNLFEDDRPRQYGCWYTREAVREERLQSGKAAVIVGIHNDESPVQRARELTPQSIGPLKYPDDMPEAIRKTMPPEGEIFDDFVLNTVMPAVESRFPVWPGRENTAFCGSSSGGLQTYYTVLSHPDRFCLAGVFSPVFPIYYPGDVIRWTKRTVGENKPYLYLYSGSGDRMEREICECAEAAAEALRELWPGERLRIDIRPEQPHRESAWAAVFKELLHLFLQ